jgi:hypothetical protein
MATMPTMTKMMEITIATIGRLMKNFAIESAFLLEFRESQSFYCFAE